MSYGDWRRFLVAQRAVVLSGFLIILALRAVTDFVPDRLWDQLWLGSLFDLIDDAAWALLLTPVVIAVHRFVIQDVVTRGYTWPLGDPAYRPFFVWLFALKVLEGLPFTLLGAMQTFDWPLLPSTAGFVAALIAAIVLGLRLTILLPAIAVQAPGALAAPALADTRGQVLRILAVFFLALIPWVIVDVGVVLLLGRGAGITGSPRAMIALVTAGILQIVTLTLCATIASHVFRALGDAVNRAPKLELKHPLSKHRLPR